MRPWLIVKSILYSATGILILSLTDTMTEYLGITVGSVVLMYCVNIVVFSIINKRYFGENAIFFDGLMLAFMSAILFIVKDDLVKVCLVWGVWSIMREGKEMSEAIHAITKGKLRYVNAIEPVIVMVFSFTMIFEPTYKSAHSHLIVLGTELLLEVLFPILNFYVDKAAEKRKNKKAQKA